MIKRLSTSFLLAISVSSQAVERPFYAQLMLGDTSHKLDNYPASSTFGFKLGYHVTENFGIELGYVDFGVFPGAGDPNMERLQSELRSRRNQQFPDATSTGFSSSSAVSSNSATTLGVFGAYSLGKGFSIALRGGFSEMNVDYTANVEMLGAGDFEDSFSISSNGGVNLYYGIRLDKSFGKRFILAAEYSLYDQSLIVDGNDADSQVSTLTANFGLKF